MHFPACKVARVMALSLCISGSCSLIEAYNLEDQDSKAFLPLTAGLWQFQSVYNFSTATALICGILNAYRSRDLVTQQDGVEYIIEAEERWCLQSFMHDRGFIVHGFCVH